MQTYASSMLPQAMRVIVPPTGNETISMLKTTSLVGVIPLTTELFFQAGDIGNRLFKPFPDGHHGRSLVSGTDISADGWAVLHRAVLRQGRHARPATHALPEAQSTARDEVAERWTRFHHPRSDGQG